jgi:hypothetical protein
MNKDLYKQIFRHSYLPCIIFKIDGKIIDHSGDFMNDNMNDNIFKLIAMSSHLFLKKMMSNLIHSSNMLHIECRLLFQSNTVCDCRIHKIDDDIFMLTIYKKISPFYLKNTYKL